jgi:hypothetical protein
MKDFLAKFLNYINPEMLAKEADNNKDFLAKFLNYNIGMLAKDAANNSASHYQNEVWLRAVIPAGPTASEIGWMGGAN